MKERTLKDRRILKSEHTFRHASGCPGAEVEPEHIVLANGDVLHRCLTCKAFGNPDVPLEPAPEPIGWRCGRHLDRRVDGRGRGCRDCAAEHDARMTARLARRRRRTEEDPQPTYPTLYLQ